MIEKTGIIGGLDLPEKAEHTRECFKCQSGDLSESQMLKSARMLRSIMTRFESWILDILVVVCQMP